METSFVKEGLITKLTTILCHENLELYGSYFILVSVDSINRGELGFPLTQYITNGRISRARNTITHITQDHRVMRWISNRMSV